MLEELRVAGIGVIDEITVAFGPGLNVLTGESGTGKSMLIAALGLVAGAKAPLDAVRDGSDEAEVEALFSMTPELGGALDEAGIPAGDEVVIARRIRRSGTRAYVNGRLATSALLGELGAHLIEVIGQHSARSLSQAAVQRGALDRYGGAAVDAAAAGVAAAYDVLAQIRADLAKLGGDPAERARRVEVLRFQLDELTTASPVQGEDTRLAAELRRLANAESLHDEAEVARDAVDTARELLAGVDGTLGRSGDPMLAAIATQLRDALAVVDDAGAELRAFADTCQSDPERLEAVQRRVAVLKELERKYGPGLDAVLEFRDRAEAELAELLGAEAALAELGAEAAAATATLDAAAAELHAARAAAAPRLAAGIADRLGALSLPNATLRVAIEPLGRTERHGADAVRFLYSGGPGLAEHPVGKVTSGGEQSRLMLALAGEIADLDTAPMLVFDEIDTGVGGETALAVGSELAGLASRRQLLCVTHLAQVAAFADQHVALARDADGAAVAGVVTGEHRVVELSRMLSGSPNSQRARRHAKELLDVAEGFRRS